MDSIFKVNLGPGEIRRLGLRYTKEEFLKLWEVELRGSLWRNPDLDVYKVLEGTKTRFKLNGLWEVVEKMGITSEDLLTSINRVVKEKR